MTERIKETYLGDGVYASIANGMVQLRTERAGINEYIYLESDVLSALLDFLGLDVAKKGKTA